MDAILAIDAGNTRIKWGIFQNEWLKTGAITQYELDTLPDLCSQFMVKRAVVSNVAGAAVRLALQKRLEQMQLDTLWVSASEQSCGVKNGYKFPQQLGSDRWAALIAAWHLQHSPCVVVNAGTAITIDLLSSQGVFMGGLILPGLALMKAVLAENTAELEHVSGSLTIIPQSTGDAMVSGAIQGISGAVIQMYDTLAEQEKSPPHVLLSGGDAPTLNAYLAYKMPVAIETVEPLVLNGLILILKEQMQKEHGHL